MTTKDTTAEEILKKYGYSIEEIESYCVCDAPILFDGNDDSALTLERHVGCGRTKRVGELLKCPMIVYDACSYRLETKILKEVSKKYRR